jgi:hypothetical protein
MTSRSPWALLVGLLIAAVASLAVGTVRAGVTQTPVATGCPAGYERLSVASLEAAAPYILPRRIDGSGNNNGYVCGLSLPDSVRDADCMNGGPVACILGQLGLPFYHFKDDDGPASRSASADA